MSCKSAPEKKTMAISMKTKVLPTLSAMMRVLTMRNEKDGREKDGKEGEAKKEGPEEMTGEKREGRMRTFR
jgi:hypothetical protein